ncbi:phospholipase/carboxylesterase [Algoriphagus iocasae]|uniref:Phospholipase/carboxylesterase n=1 Tax=Algoriphagus iocasae TaxID=1836499 RepID=A0A841MCV9_9BACT|nr:dienelactone hydrolase family protein [Algoriphagus iocasae]MBB6325902.1 phospholipase/carboxylesterase [Algoriphagus iocasae]
MPEIKTAGKPLNEAKKAAILIHGRGASASSILSLSSYLKLDEFALLAPQAEGNTWYPHSFMAPDQQNRIALESSIATLETVWKQIQDAGIKPEQVYFIGFSQGACLSLEFAARNAQKFGGVIAFTGGLIGETFQPEKYSGDFGGSSVFIGSSDRDFHVPATRIKESASLMEKMGAKVKTLLFDDPEHTIRQEEIDWVNKNILM